MKTSNHFLSILATMLLSSNLLASETDFSQSLAMLDLDLATLGELKVYTASREMTSVKDSPSVVTVITAEDIKRKGFKSFDEALSTVPGLFFRIQNHVQPFFNHRGIQQDQNAGILLLIDGVPQNMKYAYGIDMQLIFPHLSNVKRIEFVRGSSTTLWGSDAGTGIINIITYTGEDLDKEANAWGAVSVGYDYQFIDKQQNTNLQWGKKFDEGSAALSLDWTESEGDLIQVKKKSGGKNIYSGWNAIQPSHNLLFNANYKDFTLNARHAKLSVPESPTLTVTEPAAERIANSESLNKIFTIQSVNLKHEMELGKSFSTEISLHFSDKQQDLGTSDNIYGESTQSLEFITRHQIEDLRTLVGVKVEKTKFRTDSTSTLNQLAGDETINALFGETSYSGIEDVILTLGARAAQNDLRSTGGTDISPRFSALWKASPKWSVKYAYSTGIIYTPRVENISDGWLFYEDAPNWISGVDANDTYVTGTNLPEELTTQELQLSYSSDTLNASATLFHLKVHNMFTWMPYVVPSLSTPALPYKLLYGSIDEITSQGLELEWDYRATDALQVYGSYTLQDSFYSSGLINTQNAESFTLDFYTKGDEVQRVPDEMWTIGISYDISKRTVLNLLNQGFSGVLYRRDDLSTDLHKFGANYFDASVYHKSSIEGLEFSVYCKNLLDNTELKDVVYLPEYGREIGASVSYRF